MPTSDIRGHATTAPHRPAGAPDEAGTQVLVVGAGPVGLTAAHELARRGLRIRLIDAAPGPARTSRAVATHPRTLETWAQMGLVDAMLRHGRRNQAFTMYAKGRRLVRLEADYAKMPTAYPFTLVVPQTATEAVLREAVGRLGVTVEWGVRLAGFTQDARSVRARLSGPHGEEQLDVPWLVGCDGGHSTVRKQLGLPLLGETSDTWMLADAPVETDLPPDTIYWAHTGSQALMMVPYAQAGRYRLLDTVPPPGVAPGQDTAGRDVEAVLSRKLSAGLGRTVRVGPSEWTSVFTFQQRMVERMHQGRVCVAGDAAHVHSPASGQGMNTGVQDAYNLAWKLAMVVQGHAAPALLDTYSEERVPIGRALLGSTRTATFLVQLKNLLASVALPVVFSVVRTFPVLRRALQRKVLGGMSGLRIRYGDSSLTVGGGRGGGRGAVGPRPGERVTVAAPGGPGADAFHAELRDPRWTLFHVAGTSGERDAADGLARWGAGWLSVRALGDSGALDAPGALDDSGALGEPDAYDGPGALGDSAAFGGSRVLVDADGQVRRGLGLERGGWVLVRPDGYVAGRGGALGSGEVGGVLARLLSRADRVPVS